MSQWHRRYGVDAHPHCLPGIGTPSALHVALHCTVGQGRDYEAMTLTNILVCLLRFWPKVDMLHGCSFQWEAIKYAGHFVGILGGLRWHSSLCLSVCGRTPPPFDFSTLSISLSGEPPTVSPLPLLSLRECPLSDLFVLLDQFWRLGVDSTQFQRIHLKKEERTSQRTRYALSGVLLTVLCGRGCLSPEFHFHHMS